MKKTYMVSLFLCLLMFFGAITVLYSASDLYTKYLEAQKALDAMIKRTEPLRTKRNTLITERDTLSGGKWKLVIGMLNPIEIAKVLFLDGGTVQKLLELDAKIIAVEIELEPYQADLAMLESARDSAYDKYVKSLSPSEKPVEKDDPVPYVNIPEYRVECRNSCGTIFSSKVVTLAKLRDTAEKAHIVLCPDEPHKSNGFGYYSCPPDYPKVCPIPNQHKENLNQLACRGPCGKDVPNLLGFPDDSSHQTTCQEKAYRSRRVRVDGKWYIKKYVPEGSAARCP